MLSPKTNYNLFLEAFEKYKLKYPKKTIVQFLMSQEYISGVGNYIKSESLYKSKISPHRKMSEIEENEILKLFNAIKSVMINSYNSKGVSKRDFKDLDDNEGKYQFELEVYGQKKDKNGNKITVEQTKDKRTTFWVPNIQI